MEKYEEEVGRSRKEYCGKYEQGQISMKAVSFYIFRFRYFYFIIDNSLNFH